MDQEKFSQFIKDIRIKNNLTQKEFADKFGVTYQAVSKWENGKNLPDISLLKEICKEYNMSVDEFLNGEVSNKKNKLLIPVTVLLVALVILAVLVIPKFYKNGFTFKTISSNCDSFTLTGSIAYDNNKTSLYISNIIYCGEEFNSKYNRVSLTLYEKNNDNLVILDKLDFDKDDYYPIGDYLKNITFNIDGFSKICRDYKDDNLYIEVEATDKTGTTIHKIPLKIEENCSIK